MKGGIAHVLHGKFPAIVSGWYEPCLGTKSEKDESAGFIAGMIPSRWRLSSPKAAPRC